MPVLDPQFAITAVPQRDNGIDGKVDWANLPETKMVLSLDAPTPVDGKGARYRQNGTVFIPRGYDLQSGDRLPHRSRFYTVVGEPRGDYDHAFTGEDFGWVQYTVTGGG